MQSSTTRRPRPMTWGRIRAVASTAASTGLAEKRYGSRISTEAPVASAAVRTRSSPYGGTGVTRWNGFACTRRTRRRLADAAAGVGNGFLRRKRTDGYPSLVRKRTRRSVPARVARRPPSSNHADPAEVVVLRGPAAHGPAAFLQEREPVFVDSRLRVHDRPGRVEPRPLDRGDGMQPLVQDAGQHAHEGRAQPR